MVLPDINLMLRKTGGSHSTLSLGGKILQKWHYTFFYLIPSLEGGWEVASFTTSRTPGVSPGETCGQGQVTEMEASVLPWWALTSGPWNKRKGQCFWSCVFVKLYGAFPHAPFCLFFQQTIVVGRGAVPSFFFFFPLEVKMDVSAGARI